VYAYAFSPDGRALALGSSSDNTVRFWDVGRHRQVGSPLIGPTATAGPPLAGGHIATVYTVVFSPDGRTLAVASSDGTVWLWDVRARRVLGAALFGPMEADSVKFSPDDHTIASTDSNAFWLWTNDAIQTYARRLCGHIDRQLARQLWSQAQHSISYQPVC
jgi:WD40 repeat protein